MMWLRTFIHLIDRVYRLRSNNGPNDKIATSALGMYEFLTVLCALLLLSIANLCPSYAHDQHIMTNLHLRCKLNDEQRYQ